MQGKNREFGAEPGRSSRCAGKSDWKIICLPFLFPRRWNREFSASNRERKNRDQGMSGKSSMRIDRGKLVPAKARRSKIARPCRARLVARQHARSQAAYGSGLEALPVADSTPQTPPDRQRRGMFFEILQGLSRRIDLIVVSRPRKAGQFVGVVG